MMDLRSWLGFLESQNRVVIHEGPWDLTHMVASRLTEYDGQKTVIFRDGDRVLVGNTFNSRSELAQSIGAQDAKALHSRYRDALAQPLVPYQSNAEDAPVLTVRESSVRLDSLPAPLHHARDSGAYITASIAISRDPDTGIQNWSIHRLQINDAQTLGILILPRHLAIMVAKAEQRDEDLPVALVVGLPPGYLLASQAITPYGVDEATIASSLLGSPIAVVPSPLYGIEVPAESEYLLEGRIIAHARDLEGPFGEFPRTYGSRSPRPVVKIDAIYHRESPIFQTILPASREHLLLGAIPREVAILNAMSQVSPNVEDVILTLASGCRYHAVAQITPRHAGEAKNAMLAAFAGVNEVKRVIVVDSDINIHDPEDVEWAVATRVQPDRDIVVVSGALGSALDPSATPDGVTSKWAIDATIPVGVDKARFEKITVPSNNVVGD